MKRSQSQTQTPTQNDDPSQDLLPPPRKLAREEERSSTQPVLSLTMTPKPRLLSSSNKVTVEELAPYVKLFQDNHGTVLPPAIWILENLNRAHSKKLIMSPFNVFRQLCFYSDLGVRDALLVEGKYIPFPVFLEDPTHIGDSLKKCSNCIGTVTTKGFNYKTTETSRTKKGFDRYAYTLLLYPSLAQPFTINFCAAETDENGTVLVPYEPNAMVGTASYVESFEQFVYHEHYGNKMYCESDMAEHLSF